MDLGRITKLRDRGLLETGPAGLECARLSIQQRNAPDTPNYDALKDWMRNWAVALEESLEPYGASVLADTLSAAGQTVEALVPVDALRSVSDRLEREGLRLDFVEPRKLV